MTLLARAIAGVCALVAVIVLSGWAFGHPELTTFGRNWTPMVVTTALSVLFGAAAIIAIAGSRPTPDWRLVALLGAPIATIGGLTLANFASEWLSGSPVVSLAAPARMAPNTAIATMMLGGALVLMGRSRRTAAAAEALLVLALLVALNTLLAFMFGAAPQSELMGRVNMSPITGLCLAAIATTLLFQIPDGAIARVAADAGPGSRIGRPLLGLLVVVPLVFAWLRLFAQHHGWISLEYAVALTVLVTTAISAFAIFWYARRVNEYDMRQRRELDSRMFLARASDLLAQSLDLKPTLAAVAELCVPALADWCSIALLDGKGSLENVAVVHQDPAKVAWAREFERRFPPDLQAPTGVGAVARTGKAEFFPEVPDSLLAAATQDPEQLRVLRALGMRSAMSVPLIAGARTIGVLTLVTSESGRQLTQDDLRTAEQLADRCAAAIDRARLFGEVATELALRKAAEEEQRRANDALHALTAELEQRVAQRTAELAVTNRELESFAYSVSHDLRTPLRALDGFSQALIEDYADRLDEAAMDHLSRIRRGSQRMGDLIDSLLDLSRVARAPLQHERVNLSAIATDVLEALRESAPRREVCVVVRPGLTTTGDPRLLRALLQNLLGNAWKFTAKRQDARIEFTTDSGNGQQPPVFVVRDNGAGFDMAHASKLFGAFQRLHTNKEFEGTGVGLATVQRIVHRHGGEIRAESAPGQGAAFFFTLGSTGDRP